MRKMLLLATCVFLTSKGAIGAECELGETPFIDRGSECPDQLAESACVSKNGTFAYRRTSDEQWVILDSQVEFDSFPSQYMYILNRKERKSKPETLFLLVARDFYTDIALYRNVTLSINENGERGGKVGEVPKEQYYRETVLKPNLRRSGKLERWVSSLIELSRQLSDGRELVIDDSPEWRKKLAITSNDVDNDQRDLHSRLYYYSSNRISCIPFTIENTNDVESISILANEMEEIDKEVVARTMLRR